MILEGSFLPLSFTNSYLHCYFFKRFKIDYDLKKMQMDLKFFCYLVYLVNLLCFHISGAATVYNQKSQIIWSSCITLNVFPLLYILVFFSSVFNKYGTGVGWGFGLRNYFISLKTCCNTSTN